MTRHPWMKFYPGDWLSDRKVALMSPAEKGVYIDLLCLAWQEGSIPDDVDQLARLLRLTRRSFAPIWTTVRPLFDQKSPGFLTQRRVETERAEAVSRSEKGHKAAESRWSDDAQALPKQCASNAIQNTTQHKQRQRKTTTAPSAPREPTPVFQVVEAWQVGWVERFKPANGRRPDANDADWKQAKNLLAAHGLDGAIALVIRFLDDTDKFVAERGHLLRDLPSRIARYSKTDGPLFRTSPLPPMPAATESKTELM